MTWSPSLSCFADAGAKPDPEERKLWEMAGLLANTQRWVSHNRHKPRLSSGVQEVDGLLGGGWPLGKVGELVGPLSCGKTSLALATVAQATRQGELSLWVDGTGELDAVSLAAWGIPLEAVLVVRTLGEEQAVRAVELVLATGGFTVAVVDLGKPVEKKTWWAHLPLRLARAVEGARAVGLVIVDRPWMGTWAGVQVELAQAHPCFRKEEGAPPWFAGWQLKASVQRGERVGRELAWAMGT